MSVSDGACVRAFGRASKTTTLAICGGVSLAAWGCGSDCGGAACITGATAGTAGGGGAASATGATGAGVDTGGCGAGSTEALGAGAGVQPLLDARLARLHRLLRHAAQLADQPLEVQLADDAQRGQVIEVRLLHHAAQAALAVEEAQQPVDLVRNLREPVRQLVVVISNTVSSGGSCSSMRPHSSSGACPP
jgi:hypothetical protein